MECRQNMEYRDRYSKSVYMEFLFHLLALLFDCSNPVVRNAIKYIQLEKSIISLPTNVTNNINFFSR